MLFPEEDSPVLKEWIVKRLENTSDADADVLADYVLALLHNANDGDDIQGVFDEEITPFLKEDTKLFADDLIQTVRYRSYVPGAPPPPKAQPGPVPSTAPGGSSLIQPPFPNGPASGATKRGFHDRGDFDAPNGREQFQGGGRSFKQPRRGGGFGRRGYVDPDAPQPDQQMQYGYPNAPGQAAPPFAPTAPIGALPNFAAASDPVEAMRQLQQLSQQLSQQMAHFPEFLQQQQGYAPRRAPPQKKRGRCRDYDTKGYCARGYNCKFEHSNAAEPMPNLPAPQTSGQIQLSPEGWSQSDYQDAPEDLEGFTPQQGSSGSPDPNFFDFLNTFSMAGLTQTAEYDPTNATMMAAPAMPDFAQRQQNSGHPNHRRDNRQGQHQRKSGQARAPFSAAGPVHDRSQTKVVVESIPEENFEEQQVRDFFSQYGQIEEVTMMPYKRLAIVKFDNWGSANAAYRSPKVIFDNRFVKVFWYKDEKHADLAKEDANGTKNGLAGANGSGGVSAESQEEDIDMEEFTRKQEEAQKAHEEKVRKTKELENKRKELAELQAKHEAEKQRLLAKLATNSRKNSSDSGANGASTEESAGDGPKSATQTEALRATLAKLQEEAKAFGLDPHAQAEDDATISTYSPGYAPRGRGGYFRGRGSYTPRASFRGGRGGRGNIHAAYAAFSLDNRPRKVAMSGVDFSTPEKDEALRQHLFSLGEFAAEIQVTPAVTHIGFNYRAAAEKFYNSIRNKTLPGLSEGEEVELSWVANTAGPLPGSSTHKVDFTSASAPSHANANASANGGGNTVAEDFDSLMADATGAGNAGGGGGAGGHGPAGGQQEAAGGEEDYDVAGENEWDID